MYHDPVLMGKVRWFIVGLALFCGLFILWNVQNMMKRDGNEDRVLKLTADFNELSRKFEAQTSSFNTLKEEMWKMRQEMSGKTEVHGKTEALTEQVERLRQEVSKKEMNGAQALQEEVERLRQEVSNKEMAGAQALQEQLQKLRQVKSRVWRHRLGLLLFGAPV